MTRVHGHIKDTKDMSELFEGVCAKVVSGTVKIPAMLTRTISDKKNVFFIS